MRNTIASCALSTVIALTGVAASPRAAQADDELIGQLILGAVAVGLAYQLLRPQEQLPRVVTRNPQLPQAARVTPVPQVSPNPVRTSLRPRPRIVQAVAPAAQDPIVPWMTWTEAQKRTACRQSLPTRRGNVEFIADRCLNHPRAEPRIPQNCLRDRWVRGKWRQVYSRDCLDRYGEVL
ncbi:MAG: hypothetical protein QNI90_17245 [Dinoroseobacter sp.]|nr:hypothetical protein [Dinoroseobacter sp.]